MLMKNIILLVRSLSRGQALNNILHLVIDSNLIGLLLLKYDNLSNIYGGWLKFELS